MQDSRESLTAGGVPAVGRDRSLPDVQPAAAVKERAPAWLMVATGALALAVLAMALAETNLWMHYLIDAGESISLVGLGFILVSTIEVLYIAAVAISGHRDQLIPGWSSLILILTLSSAINMILLGILGVYVGMIFREVKRRPVYLVQSKTSGTLRD